MLTGTDLLARVQELASMNGQQISMNEQQTSQKRFVNLGQSIFQDLVKGYHNTLHRVNEDGYVDDDGYGEVQDHTLTYKWFAEMSFAAAEEFAKVFRHQEDN